MSNRVGFPSTVSRGIARNPTDRFGPRRMSAGRERQPRNKGSEVGCRSRPTRRARRGASIGLREPCLRPKSDVIAMTKRHIIQHVDRAKPKNRSSNKQAEVVEYLYQQGASPNTPDPVRTRTILDNVPSATRTVVKNTVEVGLVEEITPQGSDTFVYHERLGKTLYGGDIPPAVQEEQRRLIDDLKNRAQIRKVVADALNVQQTNVVQRLKNGSVTDQMETLDNAIKAIERNQHVSKGNYGRMGWRRASNKYRLTPKGMRLYQK
jgi:hypothetical protein